MESKIIIYADGGCRGNGKENNIGAYGVVLQYGGRKKELKEAFSNTTNNIMELTACIVGLKSLKIKDIAVELYTDSNYVQQGITTWIKSWKKKNWKTSTGEAVKNKELWMELDELMNSFTNIKFIKVKGHADNQGNIRADELVNEAMDEFTQI